MPRSDPPAPHGLQKVTINLRDGDMGFLQDSFPRSGGGSAAIRRIVSNAVDAMRAATSASAPAEHIDLEIPEEPAQ